MSADRRGNSKATQALMDGLAVGCSHVFAYLLGVHANDFRGMVVKVDDGGYILLVFKRANLVGALEVTFASGDDIVDALRELDRNIATDRWKEDKPWKGSHSG